MILLGVVLLSTAWTVTRADVAPDGVSMAVLAIGGLLTGLGLAKLGTPDLLAHLFAILSGVFASVLLAVERMPLAPGGRWARLGALGDLGIHWLAQARAGDPLDDPRLLSIMLGAAVWLVSYTAAWVIFRRGWLTTALALPGAIALANLGYAPEEGTLPLARHGRGQHAAGGPPRSVPAGDRVVTRASCPIPAARFRASFWRHRHRPAGRGTRLDAAALDQRLSLRQPPGSASTSRWKRSPTAGTIFVSQFGGPGDNSGGSYSAFGESFRLGGHLKLSDDPVVLLQPSGGAMRPAYLTGQRYDAYDGHGWETTVDDTFQEIGPDGGATHHA